MAEATNGDTVHIHYTGKLDDGEVFDSSEGRDPLAFEVGAGQVIPGFEEAVRGMSPGESVSTRIEPEDAYGTYREELTMSFSRSDLPDGLEPEVGQQLQMQTNEGQTFPVTVTETDAESVSVDANHALAGKALNFDIELVRID